jgi:hypothetical protein
MPSRRSRCRLALLAAVALPLAATLSAQQPGSPPPVVTESADGGLARRASIDRRYDPKLDRTLLRASIPDVALGVDLSVSAAYAGGVLRAAPDSVYLYITRIGTRRELRRGDALDLLVDGKAYLLRDGLRIQTRKVRGHVVEQVAVPMALSDFAMVANALSVGGKFGPVSFWLAGEPLDVLRDFATRVIPHPRLAP